MNKIPFLSRLTYWRPIVIALATIIYTIVFVNIHDVVGHVTAALVAFPVMLVGGLYGLRAGIIAGILSYPLNTLLFNAIGVSGWDAVAMIGGSPGQFVVLVVGGVFGWTHDILVSREHLLRQMQDLNDELNAILTVIPDVLFRLDENGVILDYRAGEAAALQFDAPVTGKAYDMLLPPELVIPIQNSNRTERSVSNVQMVVDNRYRWYEMHLVPLQNGHLIVLLQDMTQQKRTEQQRLEINTQQNRIADLQEFIGNLSHDLNTPLTVIKTSLYLLERFKEPERQHEKLEQIKLQTLHLEKLIEDIMMINRLDSTLEESMMFMRVNTMAQTVVEQYRLKAEAKGLALRMNLPETSPMILANQGSLQRVLNNIFENAITYTESGEIQVSVTIQSDHVAIAIKDTGIGMRDDEKARIFERFFRADKARSIDTGGAGLGLSIARRIIEIHQGTIHVESEPNVGTTFTIELPLFKARAREYITNVDSEPTKPDRQEVDK